MMYNPQCFSEGQNEKLSFVNHAAPSPFSVSLPSPSSSPFIFLHGLSGSCSARDDQKNPQHRTTPARHAPAATANPASSHRDGENHSSPSSALVISLAPNNSSAEADRAGTDYQHFVRALERSRRSCSKDREGGAGNGGGVGPSEARARHLPLRQLSRAPEGHRGRAAAAGGGGAVFSV